MNRQQYLQRLKAGLKSLPQSRVNEIMADYASHFDEGLAAGRSEEEVAASLGDPRRLALELGANAKVERWQEERTPTAGAAAVVALIGLIALDWFFILPVATLILILLFVAMIVAFALTFSGPFVMISGDHGQPASLFAGLCMTSSGIAVGALTVLIAYGCGKAVISWARLHVQVVNPNREA